MTKNKYRVDISEPAEHDLIDIVFYTKKDLEALITALSMIETIDKALEKLKTLSYSHLKVRDERLDLIGY